MNRPFFKNNQIKIVIRKESYLYKNLQVNNNNSKLNNNKNIPTNLKTINRDPNREVYFKYFC